MKKWCIYTHNFIHHKMVEHIIIQLYIYSIHTHRCEVNLSGVFPCIKVSKLVSKHSEDNMRTVSPV